MVLKKVLESLFYLALCLLAAYLLVCLYALTMGDRFLFASERPFYELGSDYVQISSRLDHKITLLYLPNPSAQYTILYSHGNLEDVGFIRPRLELFRRQGYSVLGYDYPGFGRSTGDKSENSIYASAEAAYHYLTETLRVPPHKIILYGRSMGGGPTAYLAEHYSVGGVVLHSTFVSAYRVQTGIKLLPWDRFDNLSRIPHIKAPIFFIHGMSDETVPAWHSKMMIETAKAPLMSFMVPYALHNNVVEMARETYWDKLSKFVALVGEENVRTQKEPPAQVGVTAIPPVPPAASVEEPAPLASSTTLSAADPTATEAAQDPILLPAPLMPEEAPPADPSPVITPETPAP